MVSPPSVKLFIKLSPENGCSTSALCMLMIFSILLDYHFILFFFLFFSSHFCFTSHISLSTLVSHVGLHFQSFFFSLFLVIFISFYDSMSASSLRLTKLVMLFLPFSFRTLTPLPLFMYLFSYFSFHFIYSHYIDTYSLSLFSPFLPPSIPALVSSPHSSQYIYPPST